VRQRQDDKRWEMRGGEDEVCFPFEPHPPLCLLTSNVT
jgi:hypothetical protein